MHLLTFSFLQSSVLFSLLMLMTASKDRVLSVVRSTTTSVWSMSLLKLRRNHQRT